MVSRAYNKTWYDFNFIVLSHHRITYLVFFNDVKLERFVWKIEDNAIAHTQYPIICVFKLVDEKYTFTIVKKTQLQSEEY